MLTIIVLVTRRITRPSVFLVLNKFTHRAGGQILIMIAGVLMVCDKKVEER